MKYFLPAIFLAVFLGGLLGLSKTQSFLSDEEKVSNNVLSVATESFCTPTDGGPFWASSVISSSQGLRKNGTPVLPERSDPNDALGAPNGVGNPASGFFSLGFGGNIVLQFSSPVYNGTGADLSFHEITNSRNTYPLEQANVEVSSNGTTWYLIGEATSEPSGDGVVYLDISSNASAPPVVNFIRITDTTNPAIHSSDADGYDLDAVDATNLCITPSSFPTPGS